MRIARFAFLSVMLVIAGGDDARPCVCSCDGDLTVERYIADASLIVVGQVLEVKEKSADPDPNDDVVVLSSCGEQWVRVAVTEVLKGKPLAEVTFVRSSVGTACDFKFPFREREKYLLFGLLGDDGSILYLSGCSPSLPKKSADSMIKRVRRQLAGAS